MHQNHRKAIGPTPDHSFHHVEDSFHSSERVTETESAFVSAHLLVLYNISCAMANLNKIGHRGQNRSEGHQTKVILDSLVQSL